LLAQEVGIGGLIIISTQNSSLVDEALIGLENGCHVLVEKPGSRNLSEFENLIRLANEKSLTIRVGYNHRFHPAILKLKEITDAQTYGQVQLVRARYGHGGRAGYQTEWRAHRDLSGGGELLDQGSHLIDLSLFLLKEFNLSFAATPTLYWDMNVEDNAFIAGKTSNGAAIWLHASWTEWKNLFSFEVFYKTAKAEVTGLGGSYGPETFTLHHMEQGLGIPTTTSIQFLPTDNSWKLEYEDIKSHLMQDKFIGATGEDATKVLEIIEEIYKDDHI
jgi:predicted dehydrogenase